MIETSIIGLEMTLRQYPGRIALLNLHNTSLYRSVTRFLLYSLLDMEKNDVVFFDNSTRMNGKQIVYIHDLMQYQFDNKQIVDKVIKVFVKNLNADLLAKETETKLFRLLLTPLLEEFNLLEVDYTYADDLDGTFYSKMTKISFTDNNELSPCDKLIAIITLQSKLFGIRLFIVNRLLQIITHDELLALNKFVYDCGINLLLIDYLDESEVVIADNMVVDREYGTYSIRGNDMI